MTFKHGAIPTEYKGIRFRSRTEARWAAFFDEVKLDWQYEPYDLSGWIPDFAIQDGVTERLAEVKPAGSFEELAKFATTQQLKNAPSGTILLGSRPMRSGHRLANPEHLVQMRLGIELSRIEFMWEPVSEPETKLALAVCDLAHERFGYLDESFPERAKLMRNLLKASDIAFHENFIDADTVVDLWRCQCGQAHWSGCCAGPYIEIPDAEISLAWARAQNLTQWRGAR